MEREQIRTEVERIMREIFATPDLVITDRTTAAEVEAWTSLRHVDLIVTIETRFALRFRTKEIRGLANVGALLDLIASRLG